LAWGYNGQGALGDGSSTTRSSPVQIGALTDWKDLSLGPQAAHTLAVKTDGTLWAWGYNGQGQLGVGSTTQKNSPVQVGALTDWSKVAAGSSHTVALKTDGTLWAWGLNANGQIGDGTSGAGANKSSPVQIGALTNWAYVAAGDVHSIAVRNDGTLWTWGYNAQGQMGNGTTSGSPSASPVQIGTLTNWGEVAGGYQFSLARKR